MFESYIRSSTEKWTSEKGLLYWLVGLGFFCALVGFGLVTAFYATPYYALWSMKSAAENKDAQKFCSFIDFPVLRENLKAELSAKVLFDMKNNEEMKNNPFAGLATVAAPAMINNMIDGYVTPAAIERAFKQDTIPNKEKNIASQTLNKDFLNEEKGNVKSGYKNFNEFQIAFSPNQGGQLVVIIFERRSLIYWQLTKLKVD